MLIHPTTIVISPPGFPGFKVGWQVSSCWAHPLDRKCQCWKSGRRQWPCLTQIYGNPRKTCWFPLGFPSKQGSLKKTTPFTTSRCSETPFKFSVRLHLCLATGAKLSAALASGGGHLGASVQRKSAKPTCRACALARWRARVRVLLVVSEGRTPETWWISPS